MARGRSIEVKLWSWWMAVSKKCSSKRVRRMSNGKDGLWDERVGPSLYAKAQGLPVKIGGLFANACLEHYVLPRDGRKTTNMNGDT